MAQPVMERGRNTNIKVLADGDTCTIFVKRAKHAGTKREQLLELYRQVALWMNEDDLA